MSIVGNFSFGNFDKTQQSSGAGPNSVRRPSQGGPYGNAYGAEAAERRAEPMTSRSSTIAAVSQDGKDMTESSEDDDQAVRNLARQYTQASTYSQAEANPFEVAPGSSIDPSSENFKPRAWAKAMLNLAQQQGDRFMGRTAGVAFRSLSAHGFGGGLDYQKSVGNVPLQAVGMVQSLLGAKQRRIDILRDLDGLVKAGEMLVVLGPPGSGCSTFLKTIAGETHGYNVGKESYVNYQGIGFDKMHKNFKGEAIYTAEQDVHFPMLTVGDTLLFAARARAPKHIPGDVSVKAYAEHMRDMIMATFGIKHTINTKVGNDFVRGVSGGERKRVSIAEAALSGAPLQLWDNSTRGLDSANAIEFCKTLRISTDISGATAAVAIYQAPQAAYDIFDKAIVLYEGRQIYFGSTKTAKQYFINLGFECPHRQTDADFLTSMTSSEERVVQKGFENKVPRTPDEFAAAWKDSAERKALLQEIADYDKEHPVDGEDLERFKQSRQLQQAKRQRPGSPYTLSYNQQVSLCLWRGFKRLKADPSLTVTQLFGNFIMALIVASVFYNLQPNTQSFFSRGALLFFAILLNAFGSALEILTLYAQRPIVEKHDRYALYHPSAEAFASMLTDMPYKICNAIIFNITIYFMTNLRREPGPFFFFLMISFFLTLVMSMLFRTIASVSRTLSQALAPAAILILAIVIYTGFAIPTTYMLGWARWINYLNPVAFGFEALMINEFAGRQFACSTFVPTYGTGVNQICTAVGSVAGQNYVDGTTYIETSYQYYPGHRWRNFGILWAFLVGLMVFYLIAAEKVSAKKSKGEVLVFRRGHAPASLTKNTPDDAEAAGDGNAVPVEKQSSAVDASDVIVKQTAIFQWHDVCYDIKIKSENRRILDHVDGWVKPGTLTALMGVSGAGKTTLLDVLATRVTMGVISGEMLVDGLQRDSSFQRKTGYVQQQDLHLETTTVREALNFSALLRQAAHIPRKEKLDYVTEIIKLLDMEEYADAVVGVPGEGLNVEQRKRLTIGVELAAKPQLLLFLDEPTSGLDSQTSWSILNLLEKLKNNGQAILCTIHQPSAMLFQRFDRLLFLAKGGRTVYFGPVGESSKTLTSYFENNGAHKCPEDANPAEWMLEVIGAAPGTRSEQDWPQVWRESDEIKEVHRELEEMKHNRAQLARQASKRESKASYREFAAPMVTQLLETTKRVFQQYWRTPSYIYSKIALVLATGLFIGFSFFKAPNTQQGLQNQLFGLFLLFTIFGQLVQQIMPLFVTQRSLYEVRERPSKTYSWKAFMFSNIVVELPWSIFCGTILFFTWYYPIGLYQNAVDTNTVHERGALMWLLIVTFLLFSSTFAHMVIAGISTAETGGNIANLMFSLSLIFCGVLASPEALPGFWIFMYRVSPFTYLVEGMLATAVRDTSVTCADNEYLRFPPPAGETCGTYMQPYINGAGTGYLQDSQSTTECVFCQISDTNVFLEGVSVNPTNMWRDFGIMWAYIVFNIFAAIFLYWLVRMPKNSGKSKKEETTSADDKKMEQRSSSPSQSEGGTKEVLAEKQPEPNKPSQPAGEQTTDTSNTYTEKKSSAPTAHMPEVSSEHPTFYPVVINNESDASSKKSFTI